MADAVVASWLGPTTSVASIRKRLALVILWLGLLFPLAVDTVRTRDQVFSRDLTSLELLRGALPVLCFFSAAAVGRPALRKVSRTETMFALFLAITIVSALWSVAPWATLLKAGSLTIAYLSVAAIARLDQERRRPSLNGLAAVVLAVVLLTLIQLAVVPQAVLVHIDGPTAPLRLQGRMPAIAADLLGFLAVIGIVMLLESVGPPLLRARLMSASLIIACLLTLALTRTRSALIMLLVGLVLLFRGTIFRLGLLALHELPRKLTLPALLLALALVGLTFFLGLDGFLTRHQDPQLLLTLNGRTVTWSDAIGRWTQRPLFGYGYYAGHRFALPVRPGRENIQNLDSMWVETLMDLGVVGLLTLCIAVGSAALDLLRPRVHDPKIGIRRTIFVLGLLSSFVNPSLQSYTYTMVVAAIVCLGAPRLGERTSHMNE